MPVLSSSQLETAHSAPNKKVFLTGPASCGKTTTGIERLEFLLNQGIPGNSILIITPQRTLQHGYQKLVHHPLRAAGGDSSLGTISGLARRMCDIFWPLIAEKAGFRHPENPPVFLTLETAQYYMAHLVHPLIEEKGLFNSITINPNRIYSQILDNLNKAAAVGFPHTEIGTRLDNAWSGDPSQHHVYDDVQECAILFRLHCLDHNLLDFSLLLEIFWNLLWTEPRINDHLIHTFLHLIYDNVEEDIPRSHDLIHEWLPKFDSAFLIFDQGAGFRRFLGADSSSGWKLQDKCTHVINFDRSFVTSTGIAQLGNQLVQSIVPDSPSTFKTMETHHAGSSQNSLQILYTHFYPQLLDEVVTKVESIIKSGTSPSEIAVLAPYLSDSLRFSITNRFEERQIPWRSHRPSRSLRDEPATHALLTLAAIAHPSWEIHPHKFDLAYSFMQSIDNLDLVRAQLLSEIVYRQKDLSLYSFDNIQPEIQERITYLIGSKYSVIRNWIQSYRESDSSPLDHFLRRLFSEVLSQPGFRFHSNLDSARVAGNLVESIRNFRQVVDEPGNQDTGREYMSMLNSGVIASQYLEGWIPGEIDAVLVAPAHTFLMMNYPVSVQFWLDPGSSGWHERLFQPLTQPYVLSRQWELQPNRIWSDADEVEASRQSLSGLVTGLLRRCRSNVILAISELGETGYEQRGMLLKAFQEVLQKT